MKITEKGIERALAFAFVLGLTVVGNNFHYDISPLRSKTIRELTYNAHLQNAPGIGGLKILPGADYCPINLSDNVYGMEIHKKFAPFMNPSTNHGLHD